MARRRGAVPTAQGHAHVDLDISPAPSRGIVALIRVGAVDDLPADLAREVVRRWERESVIAIATLGHLPQRLLIAAKPPDWTKPLEIRRRMGVIGRALAAERATTAALSWPAQMTAEHLDAVVAGLIQGGYAFDRYLPTKAAALARFTLMPTGAPGAPPNRETSRALAAAAAQAAAIAACRDQINTPAADLGPDELEEAARRIAKDGGLGITVLDERRCRALGMGALLAVGRASPRRPRMVILEHRGAARAADGPLAFCGKGVMFDTGGLNIKPANGMQLMRKDMGGAATVLAAMRVIADRGARRTIRAYLPLVENSIAGDAFRPGDVLTACDGTTIEVGHTDAEGRLILADAIAYARRQGAGAIVTTATLTGAALVALGRIHVPLMGTDDVLMTAIERAATATGEKVWRLPLDDEHRAIMKGTYAQLTNDGNGEAGCITAGAFMAHFAGKVPFAHLDISPACWAMKPHDLGPAGATGVGVTTLARFALDW